MTQMIHVRLAEDEEMIVVDEAHVVRKKGDGMYRQFLADCKVINSHVRVIAFRKGLAARAADAIYSSQAHSRGSRYLLG